MHIEVDEEARNYVFRWDYLSEYIDKCVLFSKTDEFLQTYKNFWDLKTIIYEGKLSESDSKLYSRVSCVYDSYHKLCDTLRNQFLNEFKDEHGNPIFYVKFAHVIKLIEILVDVLGVYNDVLSAKNVENLVQFSRLRNKMYYDFY